MIFMFSTFSVLFKYHVNYYKDSGFDE